MEEKGVSLASGALRMWERKQTVHRLLGRGSSVKVTQQDRPRVGALTSPLPFPSSCSPLGPLPYSPPRGPAALGSLILEVGQGSPHSSALPDHSLSPSPTASLKPQSLDPRSSEVQTHYPYWRGTVIRPLECGTLA